VLLGLSGFHDSHDHSINDVLSFNPDFLVIIPLLIILVKLLLLVGLGRHELHSDVVVSEVNMHMNLLSGSKLGLLHILFIEDLLLRVAKVKEGLVEFTLRDSAVVLHLLIGQGVMLVEQAQDDSLVAIHHKYVFFLSEQGLDLYLAMVEQPGQVPVAVLMLIEFLELVRTHLHFLGKSAGSCVLFWPMTISQNFSSEFNTLYIPIGILDLESAHEILGEVDVCEHLRDLVDSVVAALNLEFLEHEFLSFSGQVGLVE